MIYLGADHAGFKLKEEIKKYLLNEKFEIEDLGAFTFNAEDDYPDFVIPVAKAVALRLASLVQGENNAFGIVFGGSGEGEAIAANKIKGIRAVEYYGGPLEIIKLSRAHNNANILSLGARFLTPEQAKEAVTLWLKTKFEGGRHERRVEEIKEAENKCKK